MHLLGSQENLHEGDWCQFKWSSQSRNVSYLVCSPGRCFVFYFWVFVCPFFLPFLIHCDQSDSYKLSLSVPSLLCAFPGLGSLFLSKAPGRPKPSSGCQGEGTEASGGVLRRDYRWIKFIKLYNFENIWPSELMALWQWQVHTPRPRLVYHLSSKPLQNLSKCEMEWEQIQKTSSCRVA